MKHSNTCYALILVVSALLLSSIRNAACAQTSDSPTAQNRQNQESLQNQTQTQKAPTPSAILSTATPTSQPSSSPTGSSSSNSQSWNDWFWQNFSALLIAVLAIWAGYIGLRTLDAIRDQGKTARDALTKLERPWVFIVPKKATIRQTSDGLHLISVEITITNAGRSPAWLVNSALSHQRKIAEPLPEEPAYQDYRHGPTPVVPNENGTPKWLRTVLLKEQVDAFVGGTLQVFFYGRVQYSDVFGDEHETRFCMNVHPPLLDIPKDGKPISCWPQFEGPPSYNLSS